MSKDVVRKEVWIDCTKEDLEDLAIQLNATGIIGESKKGIKTLPEGSLEVELKSQEDIKKLIKHRGKVPYIVARFPEWKSVPVENLISIFQNSGTKIAVRTSDLEEMKMYSSALEVGVDAIVVTDPTKIRDACSLYESRFELQLVNADVTYVEQLDVGDRVCVDLITAQRPREGMLVGCFAHFMFLQDSETEKNPWVDTRDFRINAGPLSLYTLLKPGSTKYLKELSVGSKVLLVDAEGRTRDSYLCRSKIEKRPMVLIKASYGDVEGATISQYAETVRVITPDSSLSVMKIKPGAQVKAYVTKPMGMHFGKAIDEHIVEK